MNFSRLNSILYGCICAVLLIIITVSLIFFGKDVNRKKALISQNEQILEKQSESKSTFYSDFGKIRTFTCDSTKVPVVFVPVFKYEKDNAPLFEEICQKKTKLQNIMASYFTDKTKKQLNSIGDEVLKNQILVQINSELSMGKIEDLYFEEFLLLD
ncbi:MAG: flagellar basal body-associated FliL family protein [Treponemataceae bacterium]|nr:flagellar basal body-associated FliL family protein [Treponemataceae bacterium]